MKNRITVVFLIIAMLLSGCSKAVLKSDSDPNVDISALKSFYVRKFTPDNRGIEQIIAAQLEKQGYEASSGIENKPTGQVDAIVTYTDRWMWDMAMYMLEINIQFRDPENDYVFASGNSYRTSLVRKSPEFMIEEVLMKMLGNHTSTPENEKTEEK